MGTRHRILVVDDEPTIADTLATILQLAGYDASSAHSGEEALEAAGRQAPALLVSDVIMPGIDGITLACRLRAAHPHCAVLLFSGNAETQELLEAAQLEGENFEVLAKPVPPRQMLAKVATMLGG